MCLNVLDSSSPHAACTLWAARANIVSVILEDNYIEFRGLSLGQHRAALKTLWTEEQTRGAHSRSRSLSFSLFKWPWTLRHPLSLSICLAILLSTVQMGQLSAIYSNLTDHLPGKLNSTLEKNNNEEKIRQKIPLVEWGERAQGMSRATPFPGI